MAPLSLLRENTMLCILRPCTSSLSWKSEVVLSRNADSGLDLTTAWKEKRKGSACSSASSPSSPEPSIQQSCSLESHLPGKLAAGLPGVGVGVGGSSLTRRPPTKLQMRDWTPRLYVVCQMELSAPHSCCPRKSTCVCQLSRPDLGPRAHTHHGCGP